MNVNREELPERSKPLPNMTAVDDIAKKRAYPKIDLVRGMDERADSAAVVQKFITGSVTVHYSHMIRDYGD